MSQPLLIKPPPAVRAVLEKTASFVAKNGRAFETRILNSGKGRTAKFAFLHATSPFHAYYEDRVRHYAEGGGAEAEEEGGKDDDDKKKKTEEEGEGGGGGKGGSGKEGEKENAAAPSDGRSDTADKSNAAAAAAMVVQRRAAKASVPDPVARALLSQRNLISDQDKSRREALDALERAKRDAAASAAGGGDNNSSSKASADGNDVDLAKMECAVPVVPPPPPLVYTTLTAPSNLTGGQVEIIKLTAQYAALSSLLLSASSSPGGGGRGGGNGRGRSNFVKTLTEREWNNERVFGFLQPRDATFAYFAALVDVYKLILGQSAGSNDGGGGGDNNRKADGNGKGKTKKDNESSSSTGTELLTELSAIITNTNPTAAKSKALSLAAYRAEYDRHVEERRRLQSNAADDGGLGMGGGGTVRIDWHDFVVVETIDFAMEEIVDTVAPRPRAMFDGGDDAKKKKQKKTAGVGADADDGADGEDGDKKPAATEMDVEENAEVRLARAQAALTATAGEDDDDEPIQIDATYQAKVVSTTDSKQTTAATHAVDPISGKSVPVEHLSEHMRIQLLDPNWSKQRKTFLDKQRESNIVGGDAIAANISGFAKEKGELFGSSEQELLDREASKQRLAEANKLIREQAQQQQQQAAAVAAVGASMPPPPPPAVQPAAASALPSHPRPSGLEAAPAAKRPRVDAPSAPVVGGAAAPPPPPVQPAAAAPMAPFPAAPVVPPPPPPPAPMAPAPAGRNDTILAPDAFIASLSDPTNVEVTVQTPADSTNASWNLDGRAVSVRVDVTTGTVKTIKEACRSELGGMPTNKMQLRMPGAGFLKDKDGLAALNIGPGTTLDLVPKKRGGR